MLKDNEQGFLFNGVWITDPTLDETGRFTVDPSTYYSTSYKEKNND